MFKTDSACEDFTISRHEVVRPMLERRNSFEAKEIK